MLACVHVCVLARSVCLIVIVSVCLSVSVSVCLTMTMTTTMSVSVSGYKSSSSIGLSEYHMKSPRRAAPDASTLGHAELLDMQKGCRRLKGDERRRRRWRR